MHRDEQQIEWRVARRRAGERVKDEGSQSGRAPAAHGMMMDISQSEKEGD